MEHTMNLGSKAFIEEICPTPSRYKKKKKSTGAAGNSTSRMSEHADDNNEFDDGDDEFDDELAWLASLVNEMPATEDEAVDEDMEFDPGDLLGKVLTLINQV
jgi:hypothetical protein